MKKLFIIVFVFALSGFLSAQTTYIDTLNGATKFPRVGAYFDNTNKSVGPLPVQVISGRFGAVGVAYMRGCTDTVGASWVDTLSRKIVSTSANNLSTVSSYWWQASILSDDTIQVSSSSSFAFGTVLTITPELPVVTPRLLYSSYTNLYIRKASGVTGTPKYFITYQGN